GTVNLAGQAKLAAIQKHAGDSAFDYIGDSSADLPIWKKASTPILVNPSGRLKSKANRISGKVAELCPQKPLLRQLLRTMRPLQWSKNALIFAPLLLSHQIFAGNRLLNGLLAIITFSLAASAVYIVNDLLDLDSDRQHPYKRSRPLAAGRAPISVAVAL